MSLAFHSARWIGSTSLKVACHSARTSSSHVGRCYASNVNSVKMWNMTTLRGLSVSTSGRDGTAEPPSVSSSSSSSSSSASWSWIPPRDSQAAAAAAAELEGVDDEVIPVIKGQLLTGEEIESALIRLGGEDVRVMPVVGRLDTIKHLVIASGRSSRHLRKMGEAVVAALKQRGLRHAPGYTGIEGEKEDDWMLVDCHNIAVNLMLPKTRTALNIEAHWSKADKPLVDVSPLNTKAYDDRFEELLEQYPIPDGYGEEGAAASEGSGGELDGQIAGDVMYTSNQRGGSVKAHGSIGGAGAGADSKVILEPFAMKSILKYARSSKSGSRRERGGAAAGGGVDAAKPAGAGRIRRKSVTRNLK